MIRWKIGHRGASGYYPENTLLSFRKAIEMGANGVECDVHVCASGEAVVIHDRTLRRTTNGKGIVARTRLTQLQKLNAGKKEPIPTLTELLETIVPHATVFIEIKADKAVKEVVKTITHFATRKKIAYTRMPVISFKLKHLTAIQKLNPQICVGLTPPVRKTALTNAFIARAVKRGMWSVNPSLRYLKKPFVQAAQRAGLRVIVWTANSKADIKKAYALKVDGVMSDFPNRL